MKFEQGEFLYLLLLLVPLSLISVYRYRSKKDALVQYYSNREDRSSPDHAKHLRRRYTGSTLFFLLFLAASFFALADPYWGTRTIAEYRRGVDVVMAIDVSRSMDVRDSNPSRLHAALRIATGIVRNAPGIRFAVVIGKGNGVLAVPLTEDSESILMLLDSLSSSSISGASGTNLERLVDAALEAFPDVFPSRRRILLFSDGEALSGSLDAAAERARLEQAGLVCIGFGTADGMPVPLDAQATVFLLNDDNTPVISRLKEEELRRAADHSGGFYIHGERHDAERQLSEYIQAMSSRDAMDSFRIEAASRRTLFICLALLFWILSKACSSFFARRDLVINRGQP